MFKLVFVGIIISFLDLLGIINFVVVRVFGRREVVFVNVGLFQSGAIDVDDGQLSEVAEEAVAPLVASLGVCVIALFVRGYTRRTFSVEIRN